MLENARYDTFLGIHYYLQLLRCKENSSQGWCCTFTIGSISQNQSPREDGYLDGGRVWRIFRFSPGLVRPVLRKVGWKHEFNWFLQAGCTLSMTRYLTDHLETTVTSKKATSASRDRPSRVLYLTLNIVQASNHALYTYLICFCIGTYLQRNYAL